MLTKRERFQQWRGDKSDSEKKYIYTAEYINKYVNSVKTLKKIKDDFADSNSSEFVKFGQFGARSRGSVVFFKLAVDEAREQFLSDSGSGLLCETLANLSQILTSIYDDPRATIHILNLVPTLNTLFDLSAHFFTNKSQTQNLFFSIYTILQLIEPSLNSITGFVYYAVSSLVDIDTLKKEVQALINKIEIKSKLFEKTSETNTFNETAQWESRLNQLYLSLLTNDYTEHEYTEVNKYLKTFTVEKNLTRLEVEINQIRENSLCMIELVKSQKNLETKIYKINSLLEAAKANDLQLIGRKYFLDLFADDSELLLVFKETIKGEQKDLFLAKVEQLSNAESAGDHYFKAMRGLSWISSPTTLTYRALAPQSVQDLVTTYAPATLDSECKALLKELATNCLFELDLELCGLKQQIEGLNSQLFTKEDELTLLDLIEPFTKLKALHEKATAAMETLPFYKNLLISMKKNVVFLSKYQRNAETLDKFVQVNTNFFIKVSNFLAQFFSFFKSDAAKLIDDVNECKDKIIKLGEHYKKALVEEMHSIDKDPGLNDEVKNQIKAHFNEQVKAHDSPQSRNTSIRKRDVRLLINNLSKISMFNPDLKEESTTNRLNALNQGSSI